MSAIHGFQIWVVRTFASVTPVAAFMRTHWGWAAAESVHFIGLSLLVGALVPWDLRLLGVGRRIPIAAARQLVPWAVAGYVTTALSGVMFLMTEPTEYVYNTAFHFKMLFMAGAGLNALTFYVTVGPRTLMRGRDQDTPPAARVMAAASLALWMGVIVSGRLLTFYRPGWCEGFISGIVANCVPQIRP